MSKPRIITEREHIDVVRQLTGDELPSVDITDPEACGDGCVPEGLKLEDPK